MSKKITKDDFIVMCVSKHGRKYDYSKVDYTKMKSKVTIICERHKVEFTQTPEKHLMSKTGGCPGCNSIGKGRLTNLRFVESANIIHKNKYDYSPVNYIKSNSKVKILCKDHGIFEISPNSHLNGRGCSKCSKNYKYKINELLEICNSVCGDGYTYDFTGYKNIKSKILVSCPIHSKFETSLDLILRGYICSSCGKKSSGENRVSNYLTSRKLEYIRQKSFDGCIYKNKMQFDFFLPIHNICIEYDGIQHFEPIEYFGGESTLIEQIKKDRIKNEFCENNNIKLIRIPYFKFDDIEKILDYEICQ